MSCIAAPLGEYTMRTLTKLLVLVVLAFSALFVVNPPDAFACSCAMNEIGETGDAADAVVVGKFETVPVVNNFSTENIPLPMTVIKTFKGDISKEEVVVGVGMNGAMCGWSPVEKQEYLMFLNEGTKGEYTTSICSGNTEYTPTIEEEAIAIWGEPTINSTPSAPEVIDVMPEDNSTQKIVVFSSVIVGALFCLFGALFVTSRGKKNSSESDLP